MIANKKIYRVDAIANTPFTGNPAGVKIIDDTMTTLPTPFAQYLFCTYITTKRTGECPN